MIDENIFRKLCRSEFGGIELSAFGESLKNNPEKDLITVIFQDSSRITLTKEEAQYYAKIAAEEVKPEEELLSFIKPKMRTWVKNNRKKMCQRLIKSLENYHEDYNGVTVTWEIDTPDKIPLDVVKKYLQWYNNP